MKCLKFIVKLKDINRNYHYKVNFKSLEFYKFRTSFYSSKNKSKIVKEDEYTTYSYLSENTNDSLKAKIIEEKNDIDSINSKEINYVLNNFMIPVFALPLTIHFGISFVDQIYYQKFTYYTGQIFLKHILLVNCVNVGMMTGYKLSNDKESEDIPYKDVMQRLVILAGTFSLTYLITFCPLGLVSLNLAYMALTAGNVFIAQGVKVVSPSYSRFLSKWLLFLMASMLVILNLNFKEYNKKVSDSGKFEEVHKFYELSSDKEFKKVMNNFEEFLNEIDVKIERTKE